jgi:ankyrin repeat protein
VNVADNVYVTPLLFAAYTGKLEVFREMLERGVGAESTGNTPV